MATVQATSRPGNAYLSDSEDGQASGGRKTLSALPVPPSSSNLNQPAGSLVKGPVDDNGNLKDAALLLGIKLDLEAEIHLTARVRGDITIGLY
ncbi:hypothetical protein K432DRAFT_407527 [Lepidopterella palustris CBS 459.81]|uniref:Uncharacterized protein n=1 Tax=Lepidopterella palustris CBS 459.81 TaxID=1314670 RepID=A0A8E2E4K2_9PEZI|nr:hypothetical protein K432DRAFT_407527 [Lepidopterella palustris CBS 459.81]